MRNVIFVAPFPLETTYRFVRAAANLQGVRLLGIVTGMPTGRNRRAFDDVVQVSNPMDARALLDAARELIRRHGPAHRIIGILEAIQTQLAQVREVLGVPGTSVRTADLFRNKARMKDALTEAGLPCARHRVVTSDRDAMAFVEEVGLPVVLKPLAGMGARATWRIRREDQLKSALAALRVGPSAPVLAEEFLVGREYSFETITIDGEVQFTSLSEYRPTPLEVMENPWIQWVVLHPRDIHGPAYDGIHELGRRAVEALGMGTGITHMEWFRRNDGTLAIGEIAARPPGAQIVPGMNYVHDADFYRAWVRAVVDGAFDGPWERKYAVGVAFVRGTGTGRVLGVTGIAEANAKVGPLVVESQLPRPGAPRASGYEGEGFVVVRHPDTDVVARATRDIIQTVRVHYG